MIGEPSSTVPSIDDKSDVRSGYPRHPIKPKAPARWAASQPVAHVRSPQLLGLSESRLPLPGHANLSSGMEFLAIKRPYSAPSATLHVSRIREWAGLLQAVIPNKFGSDLI